MPWYVAGETEGAPPLVEKGDVIEVSVRDFDGNPQGEVLVGVLSVDGLRDGGPVLRGMYLGASDQYYDWWMNNGDGAPSVDDGWYHLCTKPSSRCPPIHRYKKVIHGDRSRNHKDGSLTTRKIPWLGDKETREKVTARMASFKALGLGKSPMKAEGRRRREPEMDWEEPDDEDEDEDDEESVEESGSEAPSSDDGEMKKRLKKLREELHKAEKEMEERRTGRRAGRGAKKAKEGKKKRSSGKKKKDVTLPHAGDRDEKREKKKDQARARGKTAKEESESRGRDETAKKKKKRKKKGTSSRIKDDEKDKNLSDYDYESDMRKAKAASLFTGKAEKDNDADDRGRDRGPFGEGFSVSYGDEDSESSESVFRKGPSTPAKSGQLKLIRYTNKYPGRLASRMLVKMEQATARGVGGPNQKWSSLTPAVAMHHLLTVLIPSLGEKAGMRTVRELKTLGVILDHLAVNQFAKAADVVTQRIKALERATHEKHWGAAQFLELLPPEGTMLLDRDEEMYLAREYLLDQKLKNYDSQKKWSSDRGGKGPGKDHKGQKGDKGGKDGKGSGKKNQWNDKPDKKGEEKPSA